MSNLTRMVTIVSIGGSVACFEKGVLSDLAIDTAMITFYPIIKSAIPPGHHFEYDCLELFHVCCRGLANHFQWKPPVFYTVGDLVAYQRTLRCDAHYVCVYITAAPYPPKFKYVPAPLDALSDGFDRTAPNSFLCESAIYRDVQYALTETLFSNHVLDPAKFNDPLPVHVLSNQPDACIAAKGLKAVAKAERTNNDFALTELEPKTMFDPGLAIAEELRGIHPVPLFVPPSLIRKHFTRYLRAHGPSCHFVLKLVRTPRIRPVGGVVDGDNGGAERRPPVSMHLELVVQLPDLMLLRIIYLPFLFVFGCMYRAFCLLGLAIPEPDLMRAYPPMPVLAFRLPLAKIPGQIFLAMWATILLFVLSIARFHNIATFIRNTAAIFTLSYVFKVANFGTCLMLPSHHIVSIIRQTDPLGQSGLKFHSYYDALFRESSRQLNVGGYNRELKAPNLYKLLGDDREKKASEILQKAINERLAKGESSLSEKAAAQERKAILERLYRRQLKKYRPRKRFSVLRSVFVFLRSFDPQFNTN